MSTDTQTLFDSTPRCFACGDIGFDLMPDGVITRCWRQAAGADHAEPNEAAKIVARAIHRMMIEKVVADRHAFDVVKSLVRFTRDKPCRREKMLDMHFAFSASSLRNFHSCIETLRKVWLLPVGSRKVAPAGYWIITEIGDFADWVERAKSAPITQLTTIHRLAKRNFPVFAEQMELDFWNDIDMTPIAAAA